MVVGKERRRHPGAGFRRSLVWALLVPALLLASLVQALVVNAAVAADAKDGASAMVAGDDGDGQAGIPLLPGTLAGADDGSDDGGSNDDGGDGNDDPGDGGDNGATEEDEWEGLLLSRPENSLLGIWTILTEVSTTVVITADSATRFDPADLTLYEEQVWVEVKGVRAADGRIQASRIRLDDHEAGEVVVRLASSVLLPGLLELYDLTVKSQLMASADIYLLATTEDEPLLAEQIALEAGVVWAELNFINRAPEGDGYKTWRWGGPDEPDGYRSQDAYQQVGLPSAGGHYDGDGVVVAVLDTGVYSGHEQFAGRLIWPSLDVIDDDLAPDDAGPGLAWGHGTHVAGIVAVMAPSAKLLPVRVLDSSGRGNTFLLAYAIEWAVAQGADVINLSLGTDSNSRILRDAIAAAQEAGVVVVAAAGNSGAEQVQYPAAYPGVLGVTAVSFDANAGTFVKSSFSNYGTGWIDLAAPGEGIVSAAVSDQGPGYASWSGTSMSAPFVSGASALAIQKLQGSPPATATPANVAELLIENGTELPAGGNPWAGKIGRLLDVDRALVGEDAQQSASRLLYLPALVR